MVKYSVILILYIFFLFFRAINLQVEMVSRKIRNNVIQMYEIRNFKKKEKENHILLITETPNMQGRFKTSVKRENTTIFKKLIFRSFYMLFISTAHPGN